MTDKIIENNQVSIMGKIISGFVFSHEVFGEGFYMVDVSVQRLSESTDTIPVMISERLIDVTQDYQGEYDHRSSVSFVRTTGMRRRKTGWCFPCLPERLDFVDGEGDKVKSNQIFLDGYICKTPIYRRTPLGREISDMLLAVNRPYGKSDYIPCICWGRNARFTSGFEVGGHVQIWGRIQSREYVKKLDDDTTEKRVAYEVSVSKLEYVD